MCGGYICITITMNRACPITAHRSHVHLRAVPLVASEFVAGVGFGEFCHDHIAGVFGQHGGGGNTAGCGVAADDRQVAAGETVDFEGVGKHIPGLYIQ